MPVYARASGFSDHRRHPNALLLIIGGHIAAIAVVMAAKMDPPPTSTPTRTIVELIKLPTPPPPESPPPPQPNPRPMPRDRFVDRQPAIVPIPQPADDFDFTPNPLPPHSGTDIGTGVDLTPKPLPVPDPVRVGPRFATPAWALKPPYPDDKRRLDEEAVLKLKLSIDEHGRVVAVDPVGAADRSFLEAARRHLIAQWRYKPATEDGRPVPSSTVITLRFELE